MNKRGPRADSQNGDSGDLKVPTAIDGLDYILNGGFPQNHIYLIKGESGTGKTTLALQFLLAGVRQDEAVLYLTLSETEKELHEVARSHGWSLDGVNIYELIPDEEHLKLDEQYTMFHPSEVELGYTTKAILEEVERLKPRRVILDALSEIRLLTGDPLRYRRQVLALRQFFAKRQCTVLMIDDRPTGDDDLTIQSLVHGVIMLEHLAQAFGAERRRLRVIKMRGVEFRGGYHDFKIRRGGVITYPRRVPAQHRENFKCETISSNVPGLDTLLGGGLDCGTSALFIGPAGSGKSSLTSQFAAAAGARGEPAAIFIFDEDIDTYMTRCEGLGMDIRSYMRDGLITIHQINPAELSPGEFAARVISSVEKDGARIVVIDSLNGYLHAMPEEKFLTSQMHDLLTYLNQQGAVTLLVLAQQGIVGTAMGTPVDVSYLADTLVLLRYFESAGAVRKAISVVKKRTGAHEETIRELRLSSKGIGIGKPLVEFQGVLTGIPTYIGTRGKLLEKDDDNS
ncbi:MAG: ATPase domain-containing protein [Pyrinomonadaceae bacterium]